MIIEERNVRILWLSDIHIRKEYGGISSFPGIEEDTKAKKQEWKNAITQELIERAQELYRKAESDLQFIKQSSTKVKLFFESIITFLEEDKKKGRAINYIIISGDLAFSGKREEYEILHDFFLKNYSETPIITIPGNHDCNWKTIPSFFYTLNAKTFNERFQKKNSILDDNKSYDDFLSCFKEYSDFCERTHYSIANQEQFSHIHYHLDDSKLFGVIKDTNAKVNFVLLNSAWFCFGLEYNNVIAKAFKNIDTETDDGLKKLLSAKSLVTEEAGLIIGRNKLYEVTELLENTEDWFNIVIMHHPLHWLEWSEQYNYNAEGVEGLVLHRILSKADLFLTGHEHVPVSVKYDIINQKYINLKGGMLLEDSINVLDGASNHPHNRFSILNINEEVTEERYLLNQDGGNYNWTPKPLLNVPIPSHRKNVCLSFKPSVFINSEGILLLKKEDVIESIKLFNFKHRGRTLVEESIKEPNEYKEDIFYVVRLIENNNASHVFYFVVPKEKNFIKSEKLDFIDVCHDIAQLEVNKDKKLHIGFFALDAIVNFEKAEVCTKEQLEPKTRNEIFASIENDFSLWFNYFRHDFFSKPLDEKSFKNVAEIAFFYENIPYWIWK